MNPLDHRLIVFLAAVALAAHHPLIDDTFDVQRYQSHQVAQATARWNHHRREEEEDVRLAIPIAVNIPL